MDFEVCRADVGDFATACAFGVTAKGQDRSGDFCVSGEAGLGLVRCNCRDVGGRETDGLEMEGNLW